MAEIGCNDCHCPHQGLPHIHAVIDQEQIDTFRKAWETAQERPDDLGTTCPDCHAPVNVSCVTVIWRFRRGQFVPICEPRAPHTRRLKRLAKFGPEASARP